MTDDEIITGPTRSQLVIAPTPTDEEAAAIAAALEVGWPRAAVGSDWVEGERNRWRFSGRWWSKPLPSRRDRP